MKPRYSAMLLALSLGITASAFASTPYDDVPLDHWAYDAIETLTVHGVIDGYPDGTFRGNQPITRFEMAKMIRNAVLSQDEIHDKDRKLLDKLANEYKEELKGFNVRIVELERRVGNIQWKGNIRYRYINDHTGSGEQDVGHDDDHGYQQDQRPVGGDGLRREHHSNRDEKDRPEKVLDRLDDFVNMFALSCFRKNGTHHESTQGG